MSILIVGAIGTIYFAEPIFYEADKVPSKLVVNTRVGTEVPALEMHETVFYSNYYSNPGRSSRQFYAAILIVS